jgi:DNA repair exonuclease SbcCD nuclease subunit
MPQHDPRILFLADTHLGFDLPLRPRVERCRRGPDFFRNLDLALRPALQREVDLVVHGGDLLFRSRVKPWLVEKAVAPLLRVADRGIPVVVVPGNHERSRIPFPLLAAHSRVFILDRPRTLEFDIRGHALALSGFPCVRTGIRDRFADLVGRTGWREVTATIRLLCIHQTVEGAAVGPSNYTFRRGADVIRGRDIPGGFAAVLAGHIHRHQILSSDLSGRPLAAPVFYPGSIERTSVAERDEAKGHLTMTLTGSADRGGVVKEWSFDRLPARPMVDLDVQTAGGSRQQLEKQLLDRLGSIDPTAIVRVCPVGDVEPRLLPVLRADRLRALAPPTMIISLRWRPADRANSKSGRSYARNRKT